MQKNERNWIMNIPGKILSKVIFALNLILIPVFIYPQNKTMFNNAVKLREEGRLHEAVDILEQARKKDKKNINILFELARTHAKIGMDQYSLSNRLKATRYFEEALEIEPKHDSLLFEYAKLRNWQGFKWNAEQIYKKLIENDSTNIKAYIELSKNLAEQAEWRKNMYDADTTGPGYISYEKFSRENFDKAENLLERAVLVDSTDSDIYYELGMLHLINENWNEMEKLFRRAVKFNPEFKDAYLGLGYTLYRKGEITRAGDEYEKAKNLMEDDELALMESFEKIFNPETESNSAFWTARNPSYLLDFNLRKLEHYSRVAFANLKFSKPRMNLPGWKSERGWVYIRFGKPVMITKRAPNVNIPAKEIWRYENFSFIFEDAFFSRNFTLVNRSKQQYDDIVRQTPDLYKNPYDDIKIDFPYYIAGFKGENGFLEMEVYYTIPYADIPDEKKKDRSSFDVDQGVYVFDRDWNELYKSEGFTMMPVLPGMTGYTSMLVLKSRPGGYYFVIEFKDKKNAFFGQKKLKIKGIAADVSLEMSDLLVGVPEDRITTFTGKAGKYDIIPRPSLIFEENIIKIYFEVYNLSLKNTRTDFTVNLSVSLPETEKKGLSWLAGKIAGLFRKKQEAVITNTYNYDGQTVNEKIPLTVDITTLKSHDYILIVEVIDNNTGKKASSERLFQVK